MDLGRNRRQKRRETDTRVHTATMSNYMSSYNLQSIQGPSDDSLRNNAVEGYTQVSRVGEVVINCFTDTYEYAVVPESFTKEEMQATHYKTEGGIVPIQGGVPESGTMVETRPHFYEWATATTGMIAVTRRMRSTFRNYVAAETACPVVACAACRGPLDEVDFQFAGIVRSNSIRQMDDGIGPKTDEYFTLAIGGMATILNNSDKVVHPGDMLAWTFVSESDTAKTMKRGKDKGPRRIGIRGAPSPLVCHSRALCLALLTPRVVLCTIRQWLIISTRMSSAARSLVTRAHA